MDDDGRDSFFQIDTVGWLVCLRARASEHTRARCVRGAVSDVLTRSPSLRTGLDARTRRRVDPGGKRVTDEKTRRRSRARVQRRRFEALRDARERPSVRREMTCRA